MEFEGVVYRKLPEMSGTSAKGVWKKQEVVFEMPSEFSRKICVTFFGDKVDDAARLQEGDAVVVSVNVESREFNGKWYTDVKAWRIQRKDGSAGGTGASAAGYGAGTATSSGYSQGGGVAASSGGYTGGGSAEGAPFREEFAPVSPADEVDDLPF